MRRKALVAAAGALALAWAAAGSASAVVFLAVGDSAVLDFNGIVEGVVDPDLDADLTLTLLSITGGTDYEFSYDLENNSSGDDLGARLTSFGFNVDPNFSTAAVTGTFDDWDFGNVPGGLPDVEFCATLSMPNCSGGGGGGVVVGATGTGTITLSFAVAPPAGVDLTGFYVRYQSLGPDEEGSGVGVPGIPEPATWAMMIMGFGGVGAMIRQRRRQALAA